jgi:hypothetical protein
VIGAVMGIVGCTPCTTCGHTIQHFVLLSFVFPDLVHVYVHVYVYEHVHVHGILMLITGLTQKHARKSVYPVKIGLKLNTPAKPA